MTGSRPEQRWLERLRSACSKNDGKPREEWGPGFDLKEAVLVVGLVVVVAAMAMIVGVQIF